MKSKNEKLGYMLIGLGVLILSIMIYFVMKENTPDKSSKKEPEVIEKSKKEVKEKVEPQKVKEKKEKKEKKEVIVNHHRKSPLYETCLPTEVDRYPQINKELELNMSSYVYGKPNKWIEIKIRENIESLGHKYPDTEWEIELPEDVKFETKLEKGVFKKLGDTNKKYKQSILNVKTNDIGEHEINVSVKIDEKVISDTITVVVEKERGKETRTTELFKVVEKDSDGDSIDDEFDKYPNKPAKKVVYPISNFVTLSRSPCIAIEDKEYRVYGWGYSKNVEEQVVIIKTEDETYNIRPFKGNNTSAWIHYPTFKDSSYAVVLDDEIAWSKVMLDGKRENESYIEHNHSLSLLPNKKEIFISGRNLTKETVAFYIDDRKLNVREVSESDAYTYWIGDERKIKIPEGIYIKLEDFPDSGIITAKINGEVVKEFPFAYKKQFQ